MTLLKWIIGIAAFLLWMGWTGAFRLGHRDRAGLVHTKVTQNDEFTKAIEAKVTATQLALKAERDPQRVKLEAQQQIEKWDGRLPQVVTGSGPVPLLDVFRPEPQR